jgi:hypothetical protein
MKIRSFVEFVTETLRRNVHLQFVDAPKIVKAGSAITDLAEP